MKDCSLVSSLIKILTLTMLQQVTVKNNFYVAPYLGSLSWSIHTSTGSKAMFSESQAHRDKVWIQSDQGQPSKSALCSLLYTLPHSFTTVIKASETRPPIWLSHAHCLCFIAFDYPVAKMSCFVFFFFLIEIVSKFLST